MRRLDARLATMERRTQGRGCAMCRGWQPVVLRFLTHAEAANESVRKAKATAPHPALCERCGRRVMVREYIGGHGEHV